MTYTLLLIVCGNVSRSIAVCDVLFLLMMRRPPISTRTDTLFPYTTLFRSTQAVIGVSGGVAGLEDRLLTRVLIALDHQAPLRYKQIAVRIQGFAAAFAVNYHHDDRRRTFAEMILHKLPQMWLEAHGKLRADIMAHVRSFDLVGLHLAKPRN